MSFDMRKLQILDFTPVCVYGYFGSGVRSVICMGSDGFPRNTGKQPTKETKNYKSKCYTMKTLVFFL